MKGNNNYITHSHLHYLAYLNIKTVRLFLSIKYIISKAFKYCLFYHVFL